MRTALVRAFATVLFAGLVTSAGATSTRPGRLSLHADADTAPVVHAYRTTVRRKGVAKLRFYVKDDSGYSFVAGGVFDAYSRGLIGYPGRTLSNGYHSFRWHAPNHVIRLRDRVRFCVAARNADGETSQRSCAPIRVR
jgi:hypothetical protein